MARITLIYDAKNSLAKKTLDYILSLGIFKTADSKSAIDISLEEVKKGKVNTYKSVDELFEKIKTDV